MSANPCPLDASNAEMHAGIITIGASFFRVNVLFTNCKEYRMPSNEFTWTDEETELLLAVAPEYETNKAASGVDWESVRTKHEDIFSKFLEAYPSQKDESFPHASNDFTKERITSRFKYLKSKY